MDRALGMLPSYLEQSGPCRENTARAAEGGFRPISVTHQCGVLGSSHISLPCFLHSFINRVSSEFYLSSPTRTRIGSDRLPHYELSKMNRRRYVLGLKHRKNHKNVLTGVSLFLGSGLALGHQTLSPGSNHHNCKSRECLWGCVFPLRTLRRPLCVAWLMTSVLQWGAQPIFLVSQEAWGGSGWAGASSGVLPELATWSPFWGQGDYTGFIFSFIWVLLFFFFPLL